MNDLLSHSMFCKSSHFLPGVNTERQYTVYNFCWNNSWQIDDNLTWVKDNWLTLTRFHWQWISTFFKRRNNVFIFCSSSHPLWFQKTLWIQRVNFRVWIKNIFYLSACQMQVSMTKMSPLACQYTSTHPYQKLHSLSWGNAGWYCETDLGSDRTPP